MYIRRLAETAAAAIIISCSRRTAPLPPQMAPVRCSSRPDRLGNGRGSRAVMNRHSVAEEPTRRREGTRRCHHPTKLCLFASQGTVCVCCLLTPIRSAEKNTISNYYPLESSPRPHSLPASVNRNALLVSGYVCNCSLAIEFLHVNFVVSVGGFDVREERCSRRTGDEDFADPPPRADTPKLEIPQGAPASLSACAYCRYSRGCAVLCGKSSQPTKLGVE